MEGNEEADNTFTLDTDDGTMKTDVTPRYYSSNQSQNEGELQEGHNAPG
jgi:hypothetical protein